MDDRDPARRIRALDDELAQRAAWTWALSRQANHHGEVSAEGYEEAKREVGITEPPPNTEPPEQTPGDGGARTDHQPGSPGTPLDSLRTQIAEAEKAGDEARASELKIELLTELPTP
jgi:hypothetical protein